MKRLRKSVCIILLMAILCSILPNTASAYTEKYWWWSDKEMLIEPDSIKDVMRRIIVPTYGRFTAD